MTVSDARRSAFYGLRPCVAADEYDLEISANRFSERAGASVQPGFLHLSVSCENQWSQSSLYLVGNAASVSLAHQVATSLSKSRARHRGLPASALRDFTHSASHWRDTYLPHLGVPAKWPPSWDFHAAITACSTDLFYHALWLCLYRGIEEYGIEEQKRADYQVYEGRVEVEDMIKRVKAESEHAAMRITALVRDLHKRPRSQGR
jgi:hypothetical protein